jgi:hypothetical protein
MWRGKLVSRLSSEGRLPSLSRGRAGECQLWDGADGKVSVVANATCIVRRVVSDYDCMRWQLSGVSGEATDEIVGLLLCDSVEEWR